MRDNKMHNYKVMGYVDARAQNKKISVGFEPDIFNKINSMAINSGMSFASIVRRLVSKGLENE